MHAPRCPEKRQARQLQLPTKSMLPSSPPVWNATLTLKSPHILPRSLYPLPSPPLTQYYPHKQTLYPSASAYFSSQTPHRPAAAPPAYSPSACSEYSCTRSQRSARGSSPGFRGGRGRLCRCCRCAGAGGWGGGVG